MVGDAFISDKHCNFLNNGKAKSSDIEKLIKKFRKRMIKLGLILSLRLR